MHLRQLAVTAALALAACSPDAPSGRAVGPAAGDYFPLVPGARWVYEIRTSLGRLEVEVRARGEMELPGFDAPVFVMEEKNRGPALGFVETAPVAYVVDEIYVSRISAVDYAEGRVLRSLGQDEPAHMLPRQPRPGYSWNQLTHLFQTPEGGGGRLGWSGEVLPFASIEVPAGVFPECAAVRTRYRQVDSDGSLQTAVVYEDYYARGVGLVRSVTRDPSGDPTNEIEQTLLEYGFPD